VIAAAVSEPHQNLTQPAARAVRNGTGWFLNGRKIFCTMSPAVTVLLVSATYVGTGGNLQYGYAEVPADAPGVTIHDDWDSLGMRASGSNSVTLRDVHLSESAVRGGFPVGDATGYIRRNLANGLFHAAASVGIAEAAHNNAIQRLTGHAKAPLRAPEHMLVADNAIDLSAMRATFGRAAELVDVFHQAHLASDGAPNEWTTMFAEVQAAKTFVGASATRIVDRALTLSGGAGYMRSHVLSRAYRDVRAGGSCSRLAQSAHMTFSDKRLWAWNRPWADRSARHPLQLFGIRCLGSKSRRSRSSTLTAPGRHRARDESEPRRRLVTAVRYLGQDAGQTDRLSVAQERRDHLRAYGETTGAADRRDCSG
jgi:hypothetical protein